MPKSSTRLIDEATLLRERAAVEAKPGAARHLLLQVTLTPENRCAIHRVSPFGCGYFDVHQSSAEADEKSLAGLAAIAREWKTGGLYARLWMILQAMNRTALGPLEAKRKLQACASFQMPPAFP